MNHFASHINSKYGNYIDRSLNKFQKEDYMPRLSVNMDDELKNLVESKAKEYGMSQSNYTKQLIEKGLEETPDYTINGNVYIGNHYTTNNYYNNEVKPKESGYIDVDYSEK